MEEFLRKHRYILLFFLSTPFYIVWLINSPTIRSSIDVKREVYQYYYGLDQEKESANLNMSLNYYGEKYLKRYYSRRDYNRLGYNTFKNTELTYQNNTDNFGNILNAWDGMKVLFWFSFKTIFSDKSKWELKEQIDRYAYVYGAVASVEQRGVHNTVEFMLNFGYRLGGFTICYSLLIALLLFEGGKALKSFTNEYFKHITLISNNSTKAEYKNKLAIINGLLAENSINLKKYKRQLSDAESFLNANQEPETINVLRESINQLKLERQTYKQKIKDLRTEMTQRINQVKKDDSVRLREANLKRAFEEGILTQEEYENKLKEIHKN
jgi:hypothetical protein